jgi:hypothetical protein
MKHPFIIAISILLGVVNTYGDETDGAVVHTYRGIIAEDAKAETHVALDEDLVCRNREGFTCSDICGYTMYKSHSELPFKVVLTNQTTGAAIIQLTAPVLDYERRNKYSFEIAAHDCENGRHTARERVHIEVKDVKEFDPNWNKKTYGVDLQEGRLFSNILQLEVNDNHGATAAAADFAQICHFNILTEDAPFSIDKDGVLSNTEPLDYSKRHNYILEVKAEDCGAPDSRKSDNLLINIRVLAECKAGWTGFSDRIEFSPGASHQPIARDASLQVCSQTCQPKEISTHVTLSTDHIGKGCDRDTYSIQSQRKLCGASDEIQDLLPNPIFDSWTKDLPSDDGKESDQIFAFDGKTNAIEVPTGKFNHSLGAKFTISTWMKHEPANDEEKEHIMCNADGEKMNRHHYSMFVHNCRLVFLLRQEPSSDVDLNVFKPAEWRFKIPEVCDGQWHHYAFSVDFPNVRLHVDGKRHVDEKHNPEMVDDWPLHPSKKIHFTKLVIGACWMGGTKHLTQYFKGYLAGLSVLNGATESDRVIQCLNNCKEKLDFHAMNEMETGMSVEFNSEMTEITINGHNVSNVERLIRKIGYVNSRLYPTPGHRALSLTTQVVCQDDQPLLIAPVESLVMVQTAEEPIITIEGATLIERPEADYPHGVKIFPAIQISAQTRKEAEEKVEKLAVDISEQDTKNKVVDAEDAEDDEDSFNIFTANRYKLDSCIITISPPMNPDLEHLTYPENLLGQLMIEPYQNENGLVFSGAEEIKSYAKVLGDVHYVNSAPSEVKHRTFVLTCSELNGRFVSNEFKVQADVIHSLHGGEDLNIPQAHAKETKHYETVKNYKDVSNQVSGKTDFVSNVGAHSGAGVGMIVIIVVCVGFLGFLIVLGVVRIRAAHQRGSGQQGDVEEKPEMEWDNSALTITVNPMDQENVFEEEHELNGLRDDDDSSDDDDDDDASSFHDDLESSEEEAEKVKDRELEWDDSTLTF